MGYRVFRDSLGTEWQTWDVVPQLAERRVEARRRAMLASTTPERRRVADRRVRVGRRPILSAGLHAGWLCFEAPVEKRRLSPIPSDWERCEERQLEEYLHQATPARTSTALDLAHLLARDDPSRP